MLKLILHPLRDPSGLVTEHAIGSVDLRCTGVGVSAPSNTVTE